MTDSGVTAEDIIRALEKAEIVLRDGHIPTAAERWHAHKAVKNALAMRKLDPALADDGWVTDPRTARLCQVKDAAVADARYWCDRVTATSTDASAELDPALAIPNDEGWRKRIDAPQDGTHILVCRDEYCARWTFQQSPPVVVHYFPDPEEPGFYPSTGIVQGSYNDHPVNFDMWRHLGEPPTLRALAATPSPVEDDEMIKRVVLERVTDPMTASGFLRAMQARYVERTALLPGDALPFALAALEMFETDCGVFGHSDYRWDREGAVEIVDDELEHWPALDAIRSSGEQ